MGAPASGPPAPETESRAWLRVLVAAVAIAAVLAPATGAGDPGSEAGAVGPERTRSLLASATVRVLGFGGAALEAGSGVACADGSALTNRHVVEGSAAVDVAPLEGPVALGATTLSPDADVALVRTRLAVRPHLLLAETDPAPGAPVTLAGFPGGASSLAVHDVSVVDYVSGLSRQEQGRVMRVNLLPAPGMSGGPVLDAGGRLAGLVYAAEGGTGYGLVIPASRLRRVLGSNPAFPGVAC